MPKRKRADETRSSVATVFASVIGWCSVRRHPAGPTLSSCVTAAAAVNSTNGSGKVHVVLWQRRATGVWRTTARRDMGVLPHEQRFEAAARRPPRQFDGRDGRVGHHGDDYEFWWTAVTSGHKSSPLDRRIV